MNHYLLFYETVDGYVERRQPYRNAHLQLATAARQNGSLVMAGAYDPADGAALVFRGPDESVARNFAESDPYVKHGLVTRWHIRKWTVVVGGG